MTTVNALRDDKILDIDEAIGSGDITPDEGRRRFLRLNYSIPDAYDAVLKALDDGGRQYCDGCEGEGEACPQCDGQGSVADV